MTTLALWGWDAATWSAAASWFTAAIALIAGTIAYRQLKATVAIRREQTRPYVVVYLEPSSAGNEYLDLIIKNLGTTAARNVELTLDPPAQRPAGDRIGETVLLPNEIPVLVPGQIWRTFWNTIRDQHDLPDRYDAMVTFRDSENRLYEERFVLDWAVERQRGEIITYGAHHQAKAMREIEKHLRKWREGSGTNGLSVYVRDGDVRDQRARVRRQLGHPEQRRGGTTQFYRRLRGILSNR